MKVFFALSLIEDVEVFNERGRRTALIPCMDISGRCNCDLLAKVTIPDSVISTGENAFSYISSSAKIYVPTASVNASKVSSSWSEYADKIVGYDFPAE